MTAVDIHVSRAAQHEVELDRPAQGIARMTFGSSVEAHRSHSAAAIHITADVTAMDVDFGVALHQTGLRIVLGNSAVQVGVGTATGAVDVTTVWEAMFLVVGAHGSIFCCCAADGAAIDIHSSLQEGVAVLTTTIH